MRGTLPYYLGLLVSMCGRIAESFQIEIDGRPATMADLERIEPGKIRRVESTSPDAASNRKGLLRVRTRK